MSIYYDFRKKPGQKASEKQPLLTPRVVSKGTIKASTLCEYAGAGSTLKAGELEAALDKLTAQAISLLKDGHTVEFGKLGFISLGIATDREVRDKREIHAQSIRFKSINFRPSAWLKAQFKSLSFYLESAPKDKSFHSSAQSTPEQRMKLLDQYLEIHSFISRFNYSCLTGLLKNAALKELNRLKEEGILTTHGSGSHKVWMKKK